MWFRSYFNQRKQRVNLNDHLSDPADISVGVAQGSCLGPTLFLIYINDICRCFQHLRPIMYADDTNLFYESKNLTAELPKINQDLARLTYWCQQNKFTLNLSKTQYIVIKNRQNNYILPRNLILLNNIPIKETDSVKFLGVLIDSNITFRQHAEDVGAKIRPYIG